MPFVIKNTLEISEKRYERIYQIDCTAPHGSKYSSREFGVSTAERTIYVDWGVPSERIESSERTESSSETDRQI
jgi:hypothetical protein